MKEIMSIKKEWYVIFINFLEEINELDKWNMPFFKTYDASGKYELDGDPIFSMINHQKNKIIKIIHEEEDDFNFILTNFDHTPMLICFSNLNNFELALRECRIFLNNRT